jgi:hypothetical protein
MPLAIFAGPGGKYYILPPPGTYFVLRDPPRATFGFDPERLLMTRMLRLVVGALLSLTSLTPRAHARSLTVGLHTGPILPIKSTFRARYDQSLPFGTLKVPASGYVTVEVERNEREGYYMQLGRAKYVGENTKAIALSIHPLFFGLRYDLARAHPRSGLTPYMAGGVGFYWARFAARYTIRDNAGAVLAADQAASNYFGTGIHGIIGSELWLGSSTALDIQVLTDYTRIGDPDVGGLGNVGGFEFLLGLKATL